ncbi:FAD-binding protein [Patescibacteria group bacterium]|nr:FAD-binding protein [Patescibacteria group bacterium]
MNKYNKLNKALGKRCKVNEPLSKHTTLRIGGPADIYFETKTTDEFIKTILLARSLNIPVRVLGEGSNVLISDNGIRGLVLINKSEEIEILDEIGEDKKSAKTTSRWESDSKVGTFKYEFKDLDYDESGFSTVKVKMDSGVKLQNAIPFLLDKKITGFQWYAGIPGTIGGAVFNNIHGGTHFMGEVIESVRVLDKKGKIKTLSLEDLGVGYDKSRFQKSGEIILDVVFKLYRGDVEKARYVKKEWAERKSIQPRNSPGCAFHNLTQTQKKKLDIPTTSIGFVVEHMLGLSGLRIGEAAVSEKHNNFIVNQGYATAKDYLSVMKKIFQEAKKKLKITLVPEIFLLGFEENEIKEFVGLRQTNSRITRNEEIRTIYGDSKKMFKNKH